MGSAERLGTPEVKHILGRMSAAYEQGLPLGQALPAHAQALRERQRLHIVEEGGKAARAHAVAGRAADLARAVRGGAGARGSRVDTIGRKLMVGRMAGGSRVGEGRNGIDAWDMDGDGFGGSGPPPDARAALDSRAASNRGGRPNRPSSTRWSGRWW